ncbi:hypothetical protein M5D96_012183 [Drosophila gunungcola]|uniref:Small acidic protein-like domain-containing protein n=2 Tax=Drosophila gunungcola TaxID=103775 RepID=A0A9Q0BKL6_9MUSC|nr:hypothetical protein M5D96_012183 [Drosophila gunungcola]
MAAASSGGAGGGGGLLPTPNYAPKIPSLMSLELSTPAVAAAPALEPIQLPSYYNPGIINANRYAEQQQKRKLLWGSKKSEDSANKWGNAHFSQDSDGKVASKFMRLMGIKNAGSSGDGESSGGGGGGVGGGGGGGDHAEASNGSAVGEAAGGGGSGGGAAAAAAAAASGGVKVPTDVQQRQRMFSNMEQQYEMARAATHTMRGVGLGFGSQPRTF